MYCSKCGRKLASGSKICKNCGEPVETAEYCGGFWGIVNGEEKVNQKNITLQLSDHVESTAYAQDAEPNGSHAPKKNHRFLLVAAYAILLACIFFLSIRVHQLEIKNEELSSQIQPSSQQTPVGSADTGSGVPADFSDGSGSADDFDRESDASEAEETPDDTTSSPKTDEEAAQSGETENEEASSAAKGIISSILGVKK